MIKVMMLTLLSTFQLYGEGVSFIGGDLLEETGENHRPAASH